MSKRLNLGQRVARTFTELPGGLMRVKTFGKGGRLISERIVPASEGRQIMQGHRPTEERVNGPYRRID